MPHSRFFLDEKFIRSKEIILKERELYHLMVMRKQINDIVEVINGKNQLAIAKIVHFSKKKATLQILKIDSKSPKEPKIILVQPLLRPSKIDLILEKCTEIGIDEFILFKAEYGEKLPNRKHRNDSILISAIKQCGRLDLPKLTFLNNISELKKLDYIYLLGEVNSPTYLDIELLREASKPICFLTGPEKGFSEKELNFFKNELQAIPVKINNNTLRSETTPIAVAAILSQLHF